MQDKKSSHIVYNIEHICTLYFHLSNIAILNALAKINILKISLTADTLNRKRNIPIPTS